MQRLLLSFLIGSSLLGLYACGGGENGDANHTDMMEHRETISQAPTEKKTAIAMIGSASGSNVAGMATFTEENGTVSLVLELKGVTPPGSHAVHLHEFGDCNAPDASSAGSHWNPTKQQHGHWGKDAFHLGDIGNIEIAADGTGKLTMSTDAWSVGGSDTTKNIIGKSIIVHEKSDDFMTQPTGAAGGRIGCGVVQMQ